MKTNSCIDCQSPCGTRSKRCQPCSNRINGKSKPRNPKFCKCGIELAKRKYILCHSCNMKKRWSNKEYKEKTTLAIKTSFDERWSDPITRKQIIKNINTYGGSSKLERRVANIAKQYGFEPSIAIDRYLADLIDLNRKIIVEVNGDLWHCNPNFWKADDIHPNKKITARSIWNKDHDRKFHLESLGYSVYVLWETDINTGKEKFIKEFFESIK